MDDATPEYLFRGHRAARRSRAAAARPSTGRSTGREWSSSGTSPSRTGTRRHVMYVDVYRPDTDVPAAPLVSWSPYGKHNPAPDRRDLPGRGVLPGAHRRS